MYRCTNISCALNQLGKLYPLFCLRHEWLALWKLVPTSWNNCTVQCLSRSTANSLNRKETLLNSMNPSPFSFNRCALFHFWYHIAQSTVRAQTFMGCRYVPVVCRNTSHGWFHNELYWSKFNQFNIGFAIILGKNKQKSSSTQDSHLKLTWSQVLRSHTNVNLLI